MQICDGALAAAARHLYDEASEERRRELTPKRHIHLRVVTMPEWEEVSIQRLSRVLSRLSRSFTGFANFSSLTEFSCFFLSCLAELPRWIKLNRVFLVSTGLDAVLNRFESSLMGCKIRFIGIWSRFTSRGFSRLRFSFLGETIDGAEERRLRQVPVGAGHGDPFDAGAHPGAPAPVPVRALRRRSPGRR